MTAPVPPDGRFAGRSALVTGGGSGLGRGVALALAAAGAAVTVAGRRADALDETVRAIEAAGGTATAVTADVTAAGGAEAAVTAALAASGRLDVAVNAAGIRGAVRPVTELADEEWEAVLATNLTGLWRSMRAELPVLERDGGGSLVNVLANLGAHTNRPGMGAYAASKAGAAALTRTAALEYASRGVRVNAVSPGPSDTPMSLRDGETEADRAARLRDALPAGRVGTVAEVASAVLWLASPDAGFAIGHDLVLDGGASI